MYSVPSVGWPSLRISQYDMSLVESGSNGGVRRVLLYELEADKDAHTSMRTDAHDA